MSAEGNGAPAPGRTAVLIIDMINDLAFDGGAEMLADAMEAARRVQALRGAADALGVPVVYVNDNYGQWRSERSRILEYCRRQDAPGRELSALMAPREDDYFVIKPMHSGFYATTLPVLLPRLGASRLIVTGLATDICLLFTAAVAHMREYKIWAPADCTAAARPERKQWALEIMASAMSARIDPTTNFTLEAWLSEGREPS